MDIYMRSVTSHLKLVEKLLRERLAHEQNSPVGLLLRNNRIAHTQAMIGLTRCLLEIARHDEGEWWDDPIDEPF